MKKMLSLALVLGPLMFGLAACAGGAWTKDGTNPQVAAEDLADCNSLAQQATSRDSNIDADILATRGHDWRQTQVTSFQRDSDAAGSQAVTTDVVSRCMIAKGYAPGS